MRSGVADNVSAACLSEGKKIALDKAGKQGGEDDGQGGRGEGGKVTDYPGKVGNLVHSYFLPDIFMGRCVLRSGDLFVNPGRILLGGTLP